MDERGYQIPNNASPWSGLVIASTFEVGMELALIACLGAHLLKSVLSLQVQMPGLEPNRFCGQYEKYERRGRSKMQQRN